MLATWGINTDGKPVFVGLAAGGRESTGAWSGFLEELRGRGLRLPLLVISDGAAGLVARPTLTTRHVTTGARRGHAFL